MQNTNNKKREPECNVTVFEDLGIYSSDPEMDTKINDELISFLKSIGCKPARKKLKTNNNFSVPILINKTGSEPITLKSTSVKF